MYCELPGRPEGRIVNEKRQPEFTIRDYQPSDSAAIAEIYSFWVRHGGATMDVQEKTASDIERMVADFNERECILTLEKDENKEEEEKEPEDRILGWGVIKRYSDRAGYRVCCETSVYLREGRRRQRHGSALKERLIERCRELGYHHLIARVWADNEASIEYNKKFGYGVVGIQRQIGHCHGEWRDICLMQLVLEDVPPYRPELSWPDDASSEP